MLGRTLKLSTLVQHELAHYYCMWWVKKSASVVLIDDYESKLHPSFLADLEIFQRLYGIDSKVLLTVLREIGVEPDKKSIEVFNTVECQRNYVLNTLAVQSFIEEIIKSLHRPIETLRKSVHPIRMAAY